MIHVNLTFVLPFPFPELHAWSMKTYEKLIFAVTISALIQGSLQNQYLFLNWTKRLVVKAVEDALSYIKTYVAGVAAKTAGRYL